MSKENIQYDITLKSDMQALGTIDFDRLAFLAQSITNIAKGALQIRLGGLSHVRGRKSAYLDKALKIKLKGIKSGSTVLQLETQTFGNTLDKDLKKTSLKSEFSSELLNHTPMSLFMMAFQEAFNENDDEKPFLDKFLIKDLKELKAFFKSDNEELVISNRNSIPKVILKKQDFDKIKQLESKIPDSRNVVVNGKVDILQHRKSKVTIITDQGSLYGILPEKSLQERIKGFWGQEATIHGIGHFKSNGKLSFIEVYKILEAAPEDKYFSKIPLAETTFQQVQKKLAGNKTKNWMNEIAGQWPGNETDEEFEQLLKDLL